MIDLNEILYYGRFYPDAPGGEKPAWWLCVSDHAVLDTETVRKNFSYADTEKIEASGQFLPLFRTDIPRLEKEFMQNRDEKAILRLCENNPQWDYDIAFKVYIEERQLTREWFEFERAHLRRDAEDWCRQHGLPYRK